MQRILIIEDDKRVADLLQAGLCESGYDTMVAFDGEMGIRLFESHELDLVISDIILPKVNGFDLCRRIRQHNENVPILMLTALGSADDKLVGFDAGADDYMVKPFDFRELTARVHALLKRSTTKVTLQPKRLAYADLAIDLDRRKVTRGDVELKLSPKEYNLLVYLTENAERVISRIEIASNVWNTHFDTGTNFIDVYINYLRKKLDRDFALKLIHTRPGVGYILSKEP